MSKLLVCCLIVAIAATGALAITSIAAFPEKPGPPPGNPAGLPPGPPPNVQAVAVIVLVTGIFVLAWLAVLVVFARDQILQRLGEERAETADPEQIKTLLTEVRAQLATDREREWQIISERLAEYGEQRETDGYLNGMRVATADQPVDANVRSLRRPPTQR
ncbi:hypothetical protein [Pseudosporangium ferrugineum]|uniref:LapA family protein n=1 Tax=Pseudosporangium ferrugineum TaxID=439699 RepID=A0A2T0SDP6_9ACTN|nr:hypothetical protein [Pseudosporangium ferrugineum]PRY31539.1 hypothetical protein CLV70_103427 [Pseudosporangium ferrugineum]